MTLTDKAASFARTETEEGTVGDGQTKPCGGCGARKDSERCIGCLHDFGDEASAWVRKHVDTFAVAAPTTDPDYWVKQQAEWLQRNDGETAREWVARLRRHFHAPSDAALGNPEVAR